MIEIMTCMMLNFVIHVVSVETKTSYDYVRVPFVAVVVIYSHIKQLLGCLNTTN